MRDRTKLLLVLALVALPVAGRLLWFHRGWYQPPEIPEIDESQMALPLPEYRPLADQPLKTGGGGDAGVGTVIEAADACRYVAAYRFDF